MNYWDRRRLSRRRFVGAGGAGLAGAVGFALVGCGDDDDDGTSESTPSDGTQTQTTTTSGIANAKPGDQIRLSETTYFTTTDQKSGGTFHQNVQYSGFTAEPNQAYQGDYIMARLCYNYLFGVQWPTYSTILYLADSIEAVDDMSFVVTLRDGIKWHDIAPINGRNLVAQDVVYTYDRMRADQTSTFNNYWAFADTVEATDEKTVRFTQKYPFSSRFDTTGGMSLVPEGVIEALGDLNKRGIGTGPYMFDSDYDPTGATNFVRNPNFWLNSRPFPDRVEHRHFVDQAAHIAAFRSGQIEYLGRSLQKPLADELKGSDTTVTKEPFLGLPYLVLRADKPPFNDERVRHAVSLALDRKDLLQKLDFGDGDLSGPVGWGLAPWALPQGEIDEFYNVDGYDENVAEAKKLLEAVGVDALPEFSIVIPSDLTIFPSGGPLVAGMLRNAGFKVKEDLVPLTTVVRERLIPGNFEALMLQTGTQENPWPSLSAYGSVGVVPGANGRAGFSDSDVDNALLTIQKETEFEARVEKAHEAQRVIMETYAGAMHWYQASSYLVQKNKLHDYRVSSALSAYDQYDQWLDA